MSYQQGYEYGGYQGYGQPPQRPVYQANHEPYAAQQQQHPMVVLPQQPRQDLSQHYTPPQSFQPAHQSSFYQQYPSQYEQATQQQYYLPQSQQFYSLDVQQQPSQPFQAQFQSLPNAPMQNRPVLSQNPYQQEQALDLRTLYSGSQRSSHMQPQEQTRPRQQLQASPQLPSSPDPLQTAQYHVSSRPLSGQQQPRPQAPAATVQQQSRSQQPVTTVQQQSRSKPPVATVKQHNQQPARESSGYHPSPNSSQQRVVARVEIPAKQSNAKMVVANVEQSPKRRRSNGGSAIPVCTPSVSEMQSSQQRSTKHQDVSSPLTELNSSQFQPTPTPNVDYQAVLLALADEYTAAAYSMTASLSTSSEETEELDQYYALISTAMGCLESALTNYKQSDFRTEARLRLRLATLVAEETENDQEAEELLSKGVALCERSRLTDLKYAMHHLLVRVTFKTRPKAAWKALDKLVQEVETLQLENWMYTFRLLRVSLDLQSRTQSDTAILLKHLAAVSKVAERARRISVQITAAVLEAIVYIRSGSAEAVDLAQRAMASARTHQLGVEMQQMPQARSLLECIDLACCVIQFNPDQVATKMQQMQNDLDGMTREAGWHKDGSMLVNLAPSNNDDLEKDTGGIMRRSTDGGAALVFRWIPRTQLYALGYLLSGIANMYKNSGHPEKYLHEGLKLARHTPDSTVQSLAAARESQEHRKAMGVAMQLHIIFAYCGRFDWIAAQRAIREMRNEHSSSGLQIDNGTETRLLYLEALCRHGLGELTAALELYSSPMLSLESNAKLKIAEKDIRALGVLNSVFIMRSSNMGQSEQAENLLATVESYCVSNTNKAIRAAYYVVRTTSQASNNAIIKTKQYLQAAVDASKTASNNQLLCIVMNVMTATFFTNIVGDQAEKSARAARSLAKKGQDRLWTVVADGMYGDIMERCGKAAEAEAARKEATTLLADLPKALKDSLHTHVR